MPSSIQDFLKTYQGIVALQQNQQQIDDARDSAKLAGVNTFMQLARQTANPMELTALTDRFSQLGVGTREQLSSLLANVTPTAEATKAHLVSQGIQIAGAEGKGKQLAKDTASAELTGQSEGQRSQSRLTAGLTDQVQITPELIAAMGARTVGMTPGQLAVDAAMLRLNPSEHTQGAGISLGTRMTAAQTAGDALGRAQFGEQVRSNKVGEAAQLAGLEFNYAGLRESGRHNLVNEAMSEIGLQQDLLGIQNRAAGGGALGIDASNVASLMATKAGIVKQIVDTKSTPTPGIVAGFVGALNGINQQLSSAGVPNEGQLPYDMKQFFQAGFFDSFRKRVIQINPVPPR